MAGGRLIKNINRELCETTDDQRGTAEQRPTSDGQSTDTLAAACKQIRWNAYAINLKHCVYVCATPRQDCQAVALYLLTYVITVVATVGGGNNVGGGGGGKIFYFNNFSLH